MIKQWHVFSTEFKREVVGLILGQVCRGADISVLFLVGGDLSL